MPEFEFKVIESHSGKDKRAIVRAKDRKTAASKLATQGYAISSSKTQKMHEHDLKYWLMPTMGLALLLLGYIAGNYLPLANLTTVAAKTTAEPEVAASMTFVQIEKPDTATKDLPTVEKPQSTIAITPVQKRESADESKRTQTTTTEALPGISEMHRRVGGEFDGRRILLGRGMFKDVSILEKGRSLLIVIYQGNASVDESISRVLNDCGLFSASEIPVVREMINKGLNEKHDDSMIFDTKETKLTGHWSVERGEIYGTCALLVSPLK